MKAKVFLARLLAGAMLLNSVLPAYASVRTLDVTEEPAIMETQVESDGSNELIATDSEAEEIGEEFSDSFEVSVDVSDLPDDEELLNGYIESLFFEENGEEIALFGNYGVGRLNGIGKFVYDELYAAIGKIATGEVSSPVVKVSLSGQWKAEDLGISSVNETTLEEDFINVINNTIPHVFDLLLVNCPYELYWMDKTASTYPKTNYYLPTYDGNYIQLNATITIPFQVAKAYQVTGADDTVAVDASKVQSALKARDNAIAVYDEVAKLNLTKAKKVEKFKEKICELVGYDHSVTVSSQYGDPWQMVYVFDGNPNTNVVCEGYSKAFQFLCDRAGIECYTVTGDLILDKGGSTKTELHMWNLVSFDKVNYYLADITNCDTDTIGYPNLLFLAGANGDVNNGYQIPISDDTILEYEYDEETRGVYSDDVLSICSEDYIEVLAPNEFADVTRLQELIAAEEKYNLVYIGDSPFTISGKLSVPSDFNLNFLDQKVVIDKGAEFTLNGGMQCGSLEVNGTMTANTYFKAGNSLTVTGRLECPTHNVAVSYPATISGIDKIVFGDNDQEYKWMKVQMEAEFETADELNQLTQKIKANTYYGNERVGYVVQLIGDQSVFDINQNIEIPKHTELELCNASRVSLAAGKTLTNKGGMKVLVPLEVNGKLDNSGRIDVTYDERFKASLSVKDGGEYSGDGELQVHVKGNIGLDAILLGFDLSEMFFRSNTDSDGMVHWWLDNRENVFNTFDKLESMVKTEDVSGETLFYVGTTPLEIKRNLTLPKGVRLELNGQDLRVVSGVTFTTNAEMNCGNLVVDGTLNASEWIYADKSVCISGTLNAQKALNAGSKLDITKTGVLKVADNTIQLRYPAELYGLDRIEFGKDWQQVNIAAEFKDASELASLAAALADTTKYIDHARVGYSLHMPWNRPENAVITTTINKNIVIPAHVELQLHGNRKYILAEGYTLTMNGMLHVSAPFVVNGKLVNNKNLNVNYRPNDKNSDSLGTITLGAKGVLEGKGDFNVQVDKAVPSISSVLFGFILDNYDVTEDIWEDGSKNWRVNNASGLIRLGTPADLAWGMEYNMEWRRIPGTQDYEFVSVADPKVGAISWKVTDPEQAEYQIHVYRVGETKPCLSERWGFNEEYDPEYRSVDTFENGDLESGTYYFTVQSLADYKEYRNSYIAKSGNYTYVKPNAQLETCKDLKWVDKDDRFVTWIDWAELSNKDHVDGYQVEIYYSASENGQYEQFSGMRGRGNEDTEDPVDAHFFQEKGVGYYKFRVRALSDNVEAVCNGEWSAFSPALNMTEIPKIVEDSLSDILDDYQNNASMTAEDIRDAVQSVGTQELLAALATDQDNSGATQKLAELEDKAGGAAPIQVTQDAAAFNPADISVVGANLNNKADAAKDPIKLVVDKPEKEHVIDELFNSSVAVSFSMTLENVEDPENLDVPVKITLPVPSSIHPQFLVIFHYHADGSHEIIHPYVYRDGSKWYADFVLTSFSDFVMTSVHELELVEAKTPTYTSTGNIEHYICIGCGKLFADAGCNKELTLKDVTLPKKSSGGGGGGGSSSGGGGGGSSSGGGGGGGGGSSSGSQKPATAGSAGIANLPSYVVTGQWTVVDGKWGFTDNSGLVYKNKWAAVHNPYANLAAGQAAFDWFFFDANGQMASGWVFDAGHWYYTNPVADGTQGRMLIGWQLIDGKWYYLNPISDGTKGAMITNTWIDGCYLDANGVWDQAKTK